MFPILFSFLFLPFLNTQKQPVDSSKVLAAHEFSLEKRYSNSYVNDVFKDNILLTLAYTEGEKVNPENPDWTKLEKPFLFKLSLKPGETFAFHNDVLPAYEGKITKTTNSDFSSDEGFKGDGYLVGDGVCHLASLMYWVAKDAGLDAVAPTRHDFAPVPEVPREFGTAIYFFGGKSQTNELQNLYVRNNQNKDISFLFDYNGTDLKISV